MLWRWDYDRDGVVDRDEFVTTTWLCMEIRPSRRSRSV